jgi:hypothetical protein
MAENKKEGHTIGRPCCGGRCMSFSSNGENVGSGKFVDYREFHGWYCSVNWYFLHIEQQTDSVFHHQTCQARFDRTRGPIGKLSEGDKILAELEENLKNGTMPTIVCPKKTACGCGLCTPKAMKKEDYKKVLFRQADPVVFVNSLNEVSDFE